MPILNNLTVNEINTGSVLRREYEIGAGGLLGPSTTATQIMDFTGVKALSDFSIMRGAYFHNTAISGPVDMSDLESVTPDYALAGMFDGCTGITSLDLSSLTTTTKYCCNAMCRNCTSLTSANLASLTSVTNSSCYDMFNGCTSLANVDVSSLDSISGAYGCAYMFARTALTSITFTALSSINNNYACIGMFSGCPYLTSISFPALTNLGTRKTQFTGMCMDIPNITLHFPSNMQSAVEALDDYSTTAPFGATSGSVLFDLPATA